MVIPHRCSVTSKRVERTNSISCIRSHCAESFFHASPNAKNKVPPENCLFLRPFPHCGCGRRARRTRWESAAPREKEHTFQPRAFEAAASSLRAQTLPESANLAPPILCKGPRIDVNLVHKGCLNHCWPWNLRSTDLIYSDS